MVDKPEMEFHFDNVSSCPTPSLLRSFSAPIQIKYDYTIPQLFSIIRHDTNIYNRSEALKTLFNRFVSDYKSDKPLSISAELIDCFKVLMHQGI